MQRVVVVVLFDLSFGIEHLLHLGSDCLEEALALGFFILDSIL